MIKPASIDARSPSLKARAQADKAARELGESLARACEDRSETEIAEALRLGADPNYAGARLGMPLSICLRPHASGASGAGSIRLLLSAGADPNRKPPPRLGWIGPRAALHAAATAADVEAARELLLAGAHPDARDEKGRSPLHHAALSPAAQNDQGVALATLLLEAGANLDLRDCHRVTPLLAAVGARSVRLAVFLAERGAEMASFCKSAEPALHLAADLGELGLCEAFLRLGADPHERWERRDAFERARLSYPSGEAALRALCEALALEKAASPPQSTKPSRLRV